MSTSTENISPAANPGEARALADRLKAEGAQLGFTLVGIAHAVSPTGLTRLHDWLEAGFAGEMEYIPRRADAYQHPDAVMPGVRSLIMVALNYHTRAAVPADAPSDEVVPSVPARVAQYAWSGRDYHDELKTRLRALADHLHTAVPGCHTRCVVDTAPLLERDFARLAGLGWFGKNTMLINKRAGSFFVLGAILTDVELPADDPHLTSHCGTCTRCLDACPTDAFPQPGVLDARRCLAYLTIELKTQIPAEFRSGIGDWLFGCDICQDVCPWNRKAPVSHDPLLQPRDDLAPADALAILTKPDADLKAQFRGTPLARSQPTGLKRNAAIVLGNTGRLDAAPVLDAALQHDSPIVRGAAAWALGELGIAGRAALLARRPHEDNPDVLAELDAALANIASQDAAE